MKIFFTIFLFSFLSLLGLETKAYAEQDTIIKNTNAVAPEYKVDFAISGDNPSTSFKPNASTAEQASSSNTGAGGTISFGGGKKQEVAETPTSIEDKDGKIYAVDEQGKVTKAAEKTKATESLATNMSTREKEISEGAVTFSAYKGQSYAFDEYNPQYSNASDYANKYEDFGGERVVVKAIASGKPDKVSIAFDGGMPIDSIYFLTPAGVRYKAEKDNGGYYLNLIGGEANDAQEVYAILPNRQDTTKPMTIGKLIVAAYPRQEKNLILVPVNGAKVDTAGVVKKINEIYNPVNVYWTIKIAENFENKTWDIDGDDALNVTGSKWYTTYTEEMKALKTAYSQTNNIDQRTLYMFVMKKPKTDNETSSKTIVGDMPRGKQFGFLFTEGVSNKEQLAKTIAHELGHGYFQLKHPFEMGLKQGDLKDNLMDYAGGISLNKYQWDIMHDPGIVTGLFQSDTSGQFGVQIVQCLVGASLDFAFYYTALWITAQFDDAIPDDNKPSFTDFGKVTSYKEFSWTEAIVSAGISCGAAMLPSFMAPETSKKMIVGLAALGGAATGFSTETGKQYELAYKQVEENQKTNSPNFIDVVREIDWQPVIVNSATTGIITGGVTWLVTSPKYINLVNKIKAKLAIGNIIEGKQKIIDYLEKRIGKTAGKIAKLGEKLNVSEYAISAKNSINDAMSPDHIPSFAALQKNLENKLGRPLKDYEKKELQDEGTTLLYETLLHQKYSRTYGGRNSTAQIAEDAQDLFKAAQKDMEALRKPLLESGMPEQDIEKAFELIHEMNRKKGLY